MRVAALRRALHVCVDLLLDAVLEDAADAPTTSSLPIKKVRQTAVKPVPSDLPVDELARKRAHDAMRRKGLL